MSTFPFLYIGQITHEEICLDGGPGRCEEGRKVVEDSPAFAGPFVPRDSESNKVINESAFTFGLRMSQK